MGEQSQQQTQFDLIVLGTGPAGEGAAMKAAKEGKRVAAVEQYVRVGGGCTHWGTIPSKALRRAIYHMQLLNQNPIYKRLDLRPEFDLPELLATANHVIDEQADLRESFYDRNDVPLVPGHARFVDEHTVEVENPAGGKKLMTAAGFVISTGSRPYRPPNVDFTHPRIVDSDTLLALSYTPKSIIIYGAGVIGCEYASMLAGMRCDVTLINTREKLLSFLDDEIIAALSYHFSETGIRIMHGEEFDRVEAGDKEVIVHLRSGKRERAEVFMWANGRSGNTKDLGLDRIGIETDNRGLIKVNESFQTKLPHVYAAGDVVGPPSLASASYDQGRFAGAHFCCPGTDRKLIESIPTGIYTTPEISSLGKTESELTAAKIPYEVGKAKFATLAKAQITGQTVGMLKILFHRETLELLGVHCFGDNAAEIVHIGQAIMLQPNGRNTLKYFETTTFNYPTMAEAYRVAALNGLDRVK